MGITVHFSFYYCTEEEQAETGHTFNLAEENFFRYRLHTLYPKIDEEGIKSAIGFLATQKLANCPCSVHIEERGYEWIVFRRQPDRKIYSTDDDDDDDDEKVTLPNPLQMMMYSSVLKQGMQSLIKGPMFQSQLLTVQEIWRRKVLHLMYLKKIKGPRCLLNHVNHPYIPGRKERKPQQVNPQLQDIKHIRRLKRRRAERVRKIRRQAKLVETTD